MKTKTIGSRIREARIARGMTQAELGEAIGCKRANIAQIEGGRGGVRMRQVVALCTALKIAPNALFGCNGR